VNLLQSLFGIGSNASGTQIWHANPLIIADEDDHIHFARAVDVEVTPIDSTTWNFSFIDGVETYCLTQAKIDMNPELGIQRMLPYDRLQKGNRGGFAYEGLDQSQRKMFWYFNAAADSFILVKNSQGGDTAAI
jgi:hypothetical protein